VLHLLVAVALAEAIGAQGEAILGSYLYYLKNTTRAPTAIHQDWSLLASGDITSFEIA